MRASRIDLTFDRLGVAIECTGPANSRWGQTLNEQAASAWWADQAGFAVQVSRLSESQVVVRDELPTVVIVRADKAASYGAVAGARRGSGQGLRPTSVWLSCGGATMSTRQVGNGPSLPSADYRRPWPWKTREGQYLGRSLRPAPGGGLFPVAPMLDMAFQLLGILHLDV